MLFRSVSLKMMSNYKFVDSVSYKRVFIILLILLLIYYIVSYAYAYHYNSIREENIRNALDNKETSIYIENNPVMVITGANACGEWHVGVFKEYYNIPDNVKVNFEACD